MTTTGAWPRPAWPSTGTGCWLQYRQHSLAGLAMAIGAAVMVGQTDRGDEMFLTMARRHAAHALDLEVEAVLP